jgi:hypothetical protein
MTSPLQSGQPLCKYSTPWPTPAATWTAGEQVTVKLAPGGATHDQIWVPAISRAPEFYMGCSNVAIKGGLTPYTGKEMTIVNWGSYPVIHEFSGNYNTGMEYYEKAKNITVG